MRNKKSIEDHYKGVWKLFNEIFVSPPMYLRDGWDKDFCRIGQEVGGNSFYFVKHKSNNCVKPI